MKKTWLALALSLALCGSASAAVPQEGYYLGKDGAPLTQEQQTPPAVKSAKMAPQTQAVHEAMARCPIPPAPCCVSPSRKMAMRKIQK